MGGKLISGLAIGHGMNEVNSHEWAPRLIGFETVSRRSNLDLIEAVSEFLRSHGISSTLTKNSEGSKANLLATLPGRDGSMSGGIVLSGHTDVVPVDNQNWTTAPFNPTTRDGRLYGRGACDMKGFIGCVLDLVPYFANQSRRSPIHIALSYDEEVGCIGVRSLLADLVERGVKPSGCIVGEPTNMKVVVAHKGRSSYRCCVKGLAAHSSLQPQGVNAIEYAAELVTHLRSLIAHERAHGFRDSLFDVPFSTGLTTTILGGVAMNTIPDQCEFTFEVRNIPGADQEDIYTRLRSYAFETLLPEMRTVHQGADIEFEQISATPDLSTGSSSEIALLAAALSRTQETQKVAYTTEAGLFQRAGIPTIVCGPGSISQAHRPDEYVELEQLVECKKFLMRISESLL